MPSASDELTLQLGDKQFSKRIPDIQEVEPAVANDYEDQLSHDSASTDEGAAHQNGIQLAPKLTSSIDLCLTMMQLF